MDTITELGKKVFKLKDQKAKLEKDLSKVNEELTEITTKTLSELMTNSEVDKQVIKGVGTIFLSDEVYPSVKAEDRDALHAALRKSGNGDIVKETVFAQTLKSFVKEQIERGKTLPPQIKVTIIPTVKTRKGGN